VGPQAHPYNPYHSYVNTLTMASRGIMPQPQSYADLLLKTYENQFINRYNLSSPPGAMYGPLAGIGMSSANLGLRSLTTPSLGGSPHTISPPPGSFQHLLASMTSAAAKSRESCADISAPLSGTTANLLDPDRRSSSIAALRMKAREHEIRLGIGKCNTLC
jgi:hypothetical protein